MTSDQLAKMIAELEKDATTLRAAQKILDRRQGARNSALVYARGKKAAQLRADTKAPAFKNGTEQVRHVAEQLTVVGRDIRNRTIRDEGVPMTQSGVNSALKRLGYRSHAGVWRLKKLKATPRKGTVERERAKRQKLAKHKNKKGHKWRTLVEIVRAAGQPMRFGELQASAYKAGMKATPQTFGAAMRYGHLTRNGDGAYDLGPNAQAG